MKRILTFAMLALCCLAAAAQEEWGVVNISVCNLRRTADFDAEMVSQALLGTPVQVLQISKGNNPWPEVVTPDDYNGWVHYKAITVMSREALHQWNAAPKIIVTALSAEVHAKSRASSATVSDVVAGDRLLDLGVRGSWFKVGFPDGRVGYLRRRDAKTEAAWRRKLDQSPKAILKTAESMVGFPYIWGGMSPKGFDCSGFVRTVFFMHDLIIPRDAGDQFRASERIDDMSRLVPGDLVFFGRWRENGQPRVSHVGIYMGDGRFIHSLGLVQIGSLRPQDADYDAYNAGRYLFGGRILPYIDRKEGLNTTLTNPFYVQ